MLYKKIWARNLIMCLMLQFVVVTFSFPLKEDKEEVDDSVIIFKIFITQLLIIENIVT